MHATAPSNIPDVFRTVCAAVAQLVAGKPCPAPQSPSPTLLYAAATAGMSVMVPQLASTRASLFTAALMDVQRNRPDVLQPLRAPEWAERSIDDVNGELQILANSALEG